MLHDRILLVHPSLEVLAYYRSALFDMGADGKVYSIDEATNPETAHQHLQQNIPRLIIIHHDRSEGWGINFLMEVLDSSRTILQSGGAIVMLLAAEDEEAQNTILDLRNTLIQLTYWIYNPQTQRIRIDIFQKYLKNLKLTEKCCLPEDSLDIKPEMPSLDLSFQAMGIDPANLPLEEVLKQRTAEFASVLQSIPDAVLLVDLDRKIRLVNHAFILLFGYTTEEIRGRSAAIIYKSLFDFHRLGSLYFHPGRYSYSQPYEVPYLHKLGFEIDTETVAAPVRDSSGFLLGYVSIIRDLSERRESEEALVESEERFRQLVNNMEDIFWMVDVENGTLIYISPAYEKVTDRSRHDLLFSPFQKWIDMIHPEDKDLSTQIFDIPKGQRIEWEYRIYTQSGEVKWLRERIFPILNSQNQIYRLAGLAEDITDRKLRDQEILRNRNLKEAIFNEATDALFLVAPETLLTLDCNQSAVKLFQAPNKEALIGIEGGNLQKKPFSADELESINKQMKQQGYWTTEIEYFTLKGRSFWGSLAARPIEIGGKRINLVRVTDITVQKNAALELEKAFLNTQELSTLKSQFIAMTSHEFRTPLTIIGSSAGILKSFGDRLSLESRIEHLNTIQNYVEHANRLLADVLLLSQDSLGALRFSPVFLNIVDFTRKIIQSIKLTQDRSIEFQYVNETENLQTHVDPQFIQQILINLILNAIKYSETSTTIRVNLFLTETQQSFEVQDYGIGIPEDAKICLFDSFYRASNVGSIAGTGLGLNIVKRCVDLHNGNISFVSELNKGTTFRVNLPRYSQEY